MPLRLKLHTGRWFRNNSSATLSEPHVMTKIRMIDQMHNVIEVQDSAKVGTGKANHIVLDDAMASPEECELVFADGWYVKNVCPNPGTRIQRGEQFVVRVDAGMFGLQAGDFIVIGRTVLYVENII